MSRVVPFCSSFQSKDTKTKLKNFLKEGTSPIKKEFTSLFRSSPFHSPLDWSNVSNHDVKTLNENSQETEEEKIQYEFEQLYYISKKNSLSFPSPSFVYRPPEHILESKSSEIMTQMEIDEEEKKIKENEKEESKPEENGIEEVFEEKETVEKEDIPSVHIVSSKLNSIDYLNEKIPPSVLNLNSSISEKIKTPLSSVSILSESQQSPILFELSTEQNSSELNLQGENASITQQKEDIKPTQEIESSNKVVSSPSENKTKEESFVDLSYPSKNDEANENSSTPISISNKKSETRLNENRKIELTNDSVITPSSPSSVNKPQEGNCMDLTSPSPKNELIEASPSVSNLSLSAPETTSTNSTSQSDPSEFDFGIIQIDSDEQLNLNLEDLNQTSFEGSHISPSKESVNIFGISPLHPSKKIYLYNWGIRFTPKRPGVDYPFNIGVAGMRRGDECSYHSSTIRNRLSNTEVQTFSGTVFCLEGPINFKISREFPPSVLSVFKNGFPIDWKQVLLDNLIEIKKAKEKLKLQNVKSPQMFSPFKVSNPLNTKPMKKIYKDKNNEENFKPSRPLSKKQSILKESKLKEEQIKIIPSKSKESESSESDGVEIDSQSQIRNYPSFSVLEQYELSKTKSGRRVVPPLEYWRGEGIKRDFYGNAIEIMIPSSPPMKKRKNNPIEVIKTQKVKTRSSKNKKTTSTKKTSVIVLDSGTEEELDKWSDGECERLKKALTLVAPTTPDYWKSISTHVETRTPHECSEKYFQLHPTPAKRNNKRSKITSEEEEESPLEPLKNGKLFGNRQKDRRKLRRLVKQVDKHHVDDPFDTTPMRKQLDEFGNVFSSDGETSPYSNENDMERETRHSSTPTISQKERDNLDMYISKIKGKTKRKEGAKIIPNSQPKNKPVVLTSPSVVKNLTSHYEKDSEEEEDYYFPIEE